MIASILYAELLFFIGSMQVRIDSVAVVLSIVHPIPHVISICGTMGDVDLRKCPYRFYYG